MTDTPALPAAPAYAGTAQYPAIGAAIRRWSSAGLLDAFEARFGKNPQAKATARGSVTIDGVWCRVAELRMAPRVPQSNSSSIDPAAQQARIDAFVEALRAAGWIVDKVEHAWTGQPMFHVYGPGIEQWAADRAAANAAAADLAESKDISPARS